MKLATNRCVECSIGSAHAVCRLCCTRSRTTAPAAPAASDSAAAADPLADLIKAAQAEGELNVIALPHDWCNYGEAIETFRQSIV